jgi:hypothetical protein
MPKQLVTAPFSCCSTPALLQAFLTSQPSAAAAAAGHSAALAAVIHLLRSPSRQLQRYGQDFMRQHYHMREPWAVQVRHHHLLCTDMLVRLYCWHNRYITPVLLTDSIRCVIMYRERVVSTGTACKRRHHK